MVVQVILYPADLQSEFSLEKKRGKCTPSLLSKFSGTHGLVQLFSLPAESVSCKIYIFFIHLRNLDLLASLIVTTELLSLTPDGNLVLRTQEKEKAFLTSLGQDLKRLCREIYQNPRLQVVPIFLRDSRASETRAHVKVTPREDDFHARSRFARSTIPEEKQGLFVVYQNSNSGNYHPAKGKNKLSKHYKKTNNTANSLDKLE